MKTNIGSTDKTIRIIIGLVLILAALLASMSGALKVILLVVGIIALITAFTGFCLLYRLVGINTTKAKANE